MIHNIGGGWWKMSDDEKDYQCFHEKDILGITVQECPPGMFYTGLTEVPCQIEIALSNNVDVCPDGILYDRREIAEREAEHWREVLHFGKLGKDKKVFLSGPMTGVSDYKERFDRLHTDLLGSGEGYSIINPARIFADLPYDTEYGDFIKLSLRLIDTCDTIYMMKGWETSRGARLEREYAEICGKEILYETQM